MEQQVVGEAETNPFVVPEAASPSDERGADAEWVPRQRGSGKPAVIRSRNGSGSEGRRWEGGRWQSISLTTTAE